MFGVNKLGKLYEEEIKRNELLNQNVHSSLHPEGSTTLLSQTQPPYSSELLSHGYVGNRSNMFLTPPLIPPSNSQVTPSNSLLPTLSPLVPPRSTLMPTISSQVTSNSNLHTLSPFVPPSNSLVPIRPSQLTPNNSLLPTLSPLVPPSNTLMPTMSSQVTPTNSHLHTLSPFVPTSNSLLSTRPSLATFNNSIPSVSDLRLTPAAHVELTPNNPYLSTMSPLYPTITPVGLNPEYIPSQILGTTYTLVPTASLNPYMYNRMLNQQSLSLSTATNIDPALLKDYISQDSSQCDLDRKNIYIRELQDDECNSNDMDEDRYSSPDEISDSNDILLQYNRTEPQSTNYRDGAYSSDETALSDIDHKTSPASRKRHLSPLSGNEDYKFVRKKSDFSPNRNEWSSRDRKRYPDHRYRDRRHLEERSPDFNLKELLVDEGMRGDLLKSKRTRTRSLSPGDRLGQQDHHWGLVSEIGRDLGRRPDSPEDFGSSISENQSYRHNKSKSPVSISKRGDSYQSAISKTVSEWKGGFWSSGYSTGSDMYQDFSSKTNSDYHNRDRKSNSRSDGHTDQKSSLKTRYDRKDSYPRTKPYREDRDRRSSSRNEASKKDGDRISSFSSGFDRRGRDRSSDSKNDRKGLSRNSSSRNRSDKQDGNQPRQKQDFKPISVSKSRSDKQDGNQPRQKQDYKPISVSKSRSDKQDGNQPRQKQDYKPISVSKSRSDKQDGNQPQQKQDYKPISVSKSRSDKQDGNQPRQKQDYKPISVFKSRSDKQDGNQPQQKQDYKPISVSKSRSDKQDGNQPQQKQDYKPISVFKSRSDKQDGNQPQQKQDYKPISVSKSRSDKQDGNQPQQKQDYKPISVFKSRSDKQDGNRKSSSKSRDKKLDDNWESNSKNRDVKSKDQESSSKSRDKQENHKSTSKSRYNRHVRSSSSTSKTGPVISRALRCYCLPEADIPRNFTYKKSEKYYTAPSSTSSKSTCVATQNVVKLHKEFEEKLSQTTSQIPPESRCPASDIPEESAEDDNQYISELLDKPDTDDESSSSDESEVDLDGYITIDDESDSDDERPLIKRNQSHHNNLHPELWFNVKDELNHGRECLCSSKDKMKWIVHNVYPNEQMPEPCEPLGNNGLKLYHYWVTVTPQTNFMTEKPTRIESRGQTYTFEGFSLLTHSPLDAIPPCPLTRFNIKFKILFIQEPIPDNFCIKDLDLFSKYLFHDILEMYDWDVSNKGNEDHCNLFHFLPRFTRKVGVSADGIEKFELLPMRKVFEHLIKNREPLIQDVQSSKSRAWQDSCVDNIVMKPGWKPTSLRVDEIERSGKDDPVIVHHGIRPVQLSFSGDIKCQKLMRSYLKLRKNIMNRPGASEKERLKLIKMKLTLDNMKMKDSLRRDCVVRVNATGMLKTGLNSDITQHALLLPVLVHHVRHHLALQSFGEKIGYEFKDRTLLQLALTHPSYVLNYGTNPDHARNTLSNCGVNKPCYGDKRTTYKHARKKGIVHLIDIMAKLEDLEGSQSFIQHNERLEFLGDAILEFICTTHLFFLFPEANEGPLVTYRSSLVQNRHLAVIAKKLGLDLFMLFSHGPDLCHEEDREHAMANCFEALLGAIYLDSDLNTVRRIFCKHAFEEDELRELWSNLHPHPLQAQKPDGDRDLISCSEVLKKMVKLEESIGVQFDHVRLLAKAFTHPQVGFNNLTFGNNQRMEFLGDSVVQWVVTEYLYRHFPEHHEGHLTLLRSSLVNRNIQAQIAGEIGLNQYVNFGNGQVLPKLRQKHMSDLFEAFLAALFVDKGIKPVEVFCKVCLFPKLTSVIVNQEWLDAKSQLQSCCLIQAKQPDIVPVYKVLKDVGSPNMKRYTVGVYFSGKRLGTGHGDNVREAEMKAAQNALATNYFPELARQKVVLYRKHKKVKLLK